MVRGLDKFSEHFASDADKYLLIGGTACSLLLEERGLGFRTTKERVIELLRTVYLQTVSP